MTLTRECVIQSIRAAVDRHISIYGEVPAVVRVSREAGVFLLEDIVDDRNGSFFMVCGIRCEVDDRLQWTDTMIDMRRNMP